MESSHSAQTAGAAHQEHASVHTYLRVAVVLAILTAIEIGALYVPGLPPHILVTLIIIFGTFKFALVVAFFMHLRYDSKLLTALFVGPLMIATLIILWVISLIVPLRMDEATLKVGDDAVHGETAYAIGSEGE